MAARRLVVNLRDARPVWSVPDRVLDEIRAALPDDWEMVAVQDAADGSGDGGGVSPEAREAVRGAEVYVGWGIPRDLFLAAGESLRWAHSASAGVGGALFPEMVDSDVVLTNSAGIYAEPMADTVLAMILHFARGVDFAVRAQGQARWDKGPFVEEPTPLRELSEGTVGILGFGGIGRAVAKRAAALGMRVLASRRRPSDEVVDGVEMVSGEDGFERILRESDYLVVTVPRTRETEGMIGAGEIARMKPDAVLVNVARGEVIDEGALARALRDGRLRGAGLDVFREEPLPPESPLWGLPNLLATPHVSGTSRLFWRRQADLVAGNLRRYLDGAPLLNVVDKQAGY